MRDIKSLVKSLGKLSLVLCAVFMLSGCGPEVLYSNLSEVDANTMMGLLLSRNIEAVKMGQKGNIFSVSVPRRQFAEATDLLKWYGIPAEKFSGIGEVFKKTGLVSSPSEEKIRFMYALSQEISETLSHIDGVLIARVSLVLPKNDPYTETFTPSSASVFLKFRPGLVPSTLIPQIKTLVMKSVEGLNYDNVSVVITQSESIDYYYPLNASESPRVSFFGIKLSKNAFWKVVLVMGAIFFLMLALVLGILFGRALFLEIWEKIVSLLGIKKSTITDASAPASVPATSASTVATSAPSSKQ